MYTTTFLDQEKNFIEGLCDGGFISEETKEYYLDTEENFREMLSSFEKTDDLDWSKIRDQFSFEDKRMIPINAANLCPSWNSTAELANRMRLDLNKNVSIQYRAARSVPGERPSLADLIDFVRDTAAATLGVNSDEIALVRNGTEGNNAINGGIQLQNGDRVLLWDQNHPTNLTAWRLREETLAKRGIRIHIDLVKNIPRDIDPEKIPALFAQMRTPQTRVVSFTEISNGNGMRLPAKAIIKAVRDELPEVPIHAHVDGSMSWGSLNLDLKDMDCDSFTSSNHKWFLGPKETGILYMRDGLAGNFVPNILGYDGRIEVPTTPDRIPKTAARFELIGQRDDPTLLALYDTLTKNSSIGFAAIEQRVEQLTKLTIGLLKPLVDAKLIEMTSPTEKSLRHGIVIFTINKGTKPGKRLYDHLYKEHQIGVAISQNDQGIRFAPHIYNLESHIVKAVGAVSNWVRNIN